MNFLNYKIKRHLSRLQHKQSAFLRSWSLSDSFLAERISTGAFGITILINVRADFQFSIDLSPFGSA